MVRRLASPMLLRIAKQKDAEHANHATLLSVARLNASRAAGLALVARAACSGKSGLSRNTPSGGVLRRAQRVSSHTPNRNPKVSHSANATRAARLSASFPGIKLVRGWSMRVGEMVRASLEFDMVYGERVRPWHV
jgi:hypothetical protein